MLWASEGRLLRRSELHLVCEDALRGRDVLPVELLELRERGDDKLAVPVPVRAGVPEQVQLLQVVVPLEAVQGKGRPGG